MAILAPNSTPVDLDPSFSSMVAALTEHYIQRWRQLDPRFPAGGRKYTLWEKFPRERRLQRYIQETIAVLKDPPRTAQAQAAARSRLEGLFSDFALHALDLEAAHLDIIRRYGFVDAALAFVQEARLYDPSISADDIYQAARNVWTMNLIQFLLGMPVRLTPSIFAYSMLYPYSDNYLDDPAVTPSLKLDFNRRFRLRLLGQRPAALNPQEEKIFNLVDKVEAEFARVRYPQVYHSLLAIHRAQEKSLGLLRGFTYLDEENVLAVSFEKGGAAVLADGYLVAGDLTPAQQEALYGYGVFTQLMDDQEDLPADLEAGQLTLFTCAVSTRRLDEVTNRTLRLGEAIMDAISAFDAPGAPAVEQFFRRSVRLLLIDAAGSLRRYYPPAYLRRLHPYLPFRFSFLARERRRLARRKLSLSSLVDAFGRMPCPAITPD